MMVLMNSFWEEILGLYYRAHSLPVADLFQLAVSSNSLTADAVPQHRPQPSILA